MEGPTVLSGTPPVPFRIAFVPGVTVGKWTRIWGQRMRVPLEVTPIIDRDQLAVLHDGLADMSFVRLPVDRDGISLIPLYRETLVVIAPKDHPVEAFDEVTVADLADEHLLQDPDEVPEWRDIAIEVRDGTRVAVPPMTLKEAIETVAAGTGIVIVAKSVARLYDRKDVTHRPVTGVAESAVGLAWLTATTTPHIETFIGIVRGRTARSSRTSASTAPEQKTAPKRRGSTRGGGRRSSGR